MPKTLLQGLASALNKRKAELDKLRPPLATGVERPISNDFEETDIQTDVNKINELLKEHTEVMKSGETDVDFVNRIKKSFRSQVAQQYLRDPKLEELKQN